MGREHSGEMLSRCLSARGDLRLYVPSDCVASLTREDSRRGLEQIEKRLDADVRPSTELNVGTLKLTP